MPHDDDERRTGRDYSSTEAHPAQAKKVTATQTTATKKIVTRFRLARGIPRHTGCPALKS